MNKLTVALVVLAPLLFAGAPRGGQAPQHPKPDNRGAPPPAQQPQKPRSTPPPAPRDGGHQGGSDDGRDED